MQVPPLATLEGQTGSPKAPLVPPGPTEPPDPVVPAWPLVPACPVVPASPVVPAAPLPAEPVVPAVPLMPLLLPPQPWDMNALATSAAAPSDEMIGRIRLVIEILVF